MDGVPSTTGQIHASALRPTMPTPKRWVIRRKAEVVAAVRDGLLTLEEACSRYMLTVEEFLSWLIRLISTVSRVCAPGKSSKNTTAISDLVTVRPALGVEKGGSRPICVHCHSS